MPTRSRRAHARAPLSVRRRPSSPAQPLPRRCRRRARPPLQERRQEAATIASQAVEVHETFKDLGGLVSSQGETLAKVEATVDASHATVVRANQDLVAAASYQRAYRKKCCLFWLLFLAVVAAITIPLVIHFTPHA